MIITAARLDRLRPVEGVVEPGEVGRGGRATAARAGHVERGEDDAAPLPAGVLGDAGLAALGIGSVPSDVAVEKNTRRMAGSRPSGSGQSCHSLSPGV